MEDFRKLESDDMELLEEFLSDHLESSMFLLSNARRGGLEDCGEVYQGMYLSRWDDGRITDVCGHFWNGNIIVQAPSQPLDLWRHAIEVSNKPITGLIGPLEQIHRIKTDFQPPATMISLDEEDDLYALDLERLSVPDSLTSGKYTGRRMCEDDIPLAAKWMVDYSCETLGSRPSIELDKHCLNIVERSLQEQSTWILEDNGAPRSCASFNARISEMVQLGGVWTPPEFRNKGYGRAVVAAALIDAQQEGTRKAILFTGKRNFAAQRVYESIGFKQIGEYELLLLTEPAHVSP